MKAKLLLLATLAVLFNACISNDRTLPAVTGSQFELLIVVNDTAWNSEVGKELFRIFAQETPSLPQPEPLMDVKQCNHVEFSDLLKPSRNILMVNISNKYTTTKIRYSKDRWSYPQTVVRITAPDDSTLLKSLKQYELPLQDYFIASERDRQIRFYKDYINAKAQGEIEKQFGIIVNVPQGISKSVQKKDFYWITNDQAGVRQDIIVYSYPYTDKKMFSKEALIAKRDSILKANIPGELKGSFMGTETKYADPEFREIWVNKAYCAELRGLWKMFNGASMGGPFYSHSRLDEVNQRIVTVEGFVFAPGKKKRNPMRQLEAVVYTTRLPHEINALNEVVVEAKKVNADSVK